MQSKKNHCGLSPSGTVYQTRQDLDSEVRRAIQIIVREIGPVFRFGMYTQEDLLQEAYIWALEALPRWDPERGGNRYTFLKRVIWNKMSSLKRDKFERREKPCAQCPLGGTLHPGETSCTEYTDVSDCDFYRGWIERNTAKRSLAAGSSSPPDFQGGSDSSRVGTTLEISGSLDFFQAVVSDSAGFRALRKGEALGADRRQALWEELVEAVSGEDPDEFFV